MTKDQMLELKKCKGKRCFILASGPSLEDVDLSLLKDEITICVNESYKSVPFEPTYLCIGEYKLWPDVKSDYANFKKTKIITGSGLNGTCGKDYKGTNRIFHFELDPKKSIYEDGFHWDLENKPLYKGFSVVPEIALPFVCWAGFKECYLLGCDCKQNGYSYQNPIMGLKEQTIDQRVFKTFDKIAESDLSTKIINLTEGSAIMSFPRKEVLEVLFPNKTKIEEYMFVGYFTRNQNYPELAERMKQSVLDQGLPCEIFEREGISRKLPPPMGWVTNCSICAQFCLDMFNLYPDKHIVYLDADAVMEKFPLLLIDPKLPNFDLAAPFLTNKWSTNELVSNILIFRRTENAKKLLEKWVEETQVRLQNMENRKYKPPYFEAWDQQVLQDMLEYVPCNVYKLPWEYAKITKHLPEQS